MIACVITFPRRGSFCAEQNVSFNAPRAHTTANVNYEIIEKRIAHTFHN